MIGKTLTRILRSRLDTKQVIKMAQVSNKTYGDQGLQDLHTKFPALPPSPPDVALSYCRATFEAPITALMGIAVDARQPRKHPVSPRHRVRKQTGLSNRWRLPESLGSDLLGSSQAWKSVNIPCYNPSATKVISSESPHGNVNREAEEAYKFSHSPTRPMTEPSFQPVLPPPGSRRKSKGRKPTTAPTNAKRAGDDLPKFTPPNARLTKPMDVFQYHSKRSTTTAGPDVLLKCLGMNWELHRPFLQKADVLAELVEQADYPTPQLYYKSKVSETLDQHVERSKIYSNDYSKGELVNSDVQIVDIVDGIEGFEHPKHVSQPRINSLTVIELEIQDPIVTAHTLAVALGNLYHEDVEVDEQDLCGVLAAANCLGFIHLIHGCGNMMVHTINAHTVCNYHEAAVKYHLDPVEEACERWLELNLIPKLAATIQLRQLTIDLLHKILRSSKLFVYGEFSLFRVLSFWVFLQMNPGMQLMPSYGTVLSFFTSLPKSSALIEREEGQRFMPLFTAMRLHGIFDTAHLQDIHTTNIIPQNWLIKVYSQHYSSIQGGGDMSLLNNFDCGAVRQGFIIDEEPHYHSEVLSLHGFHFELKSGREKPGSYSFYMQRLKPSDPILSFRQCERHTFSLRPEREVRYSIRVQHFDKDDRAQNYGTGIITQKFGLGSKSCKGQVIKLDNLKTPIYVSFSLLMPPS